MNDTRNYAAQAESALIKMSKKTLPYKQGEDDAFMYKIIASTIKGAVHFSIPNNGMIFDDDLKGIDGIHIRLPYPAITIGYFVEDDSQIRNEQLPVYSPKRLVVATEITKDVLAKHVESFGSDFSSHEEEILNRLSDFPDEEIIYIYVVNVIDGQWMLCPIGWIMPSKWNDRKDFGMTVKNNLFHKRKDLTVTGKPAVVLPGYFSLMANMYGENGAVSKGSSDIMGEVRAVLELCEALTCSNVTSEVVQRENKKTNAKRLRKGKLPIYETRVLTIDVPSTAHHPQGKKQGDRNSPRHHLRRGHIRRLPTKNVWVNSCSVGSAGLGRIDKSYNVTGANHATKRV